MLVLILNNITLREVSQTEKDKDLVIFLICGVKRMIQMNLFTNDTNLFVENKVIVTKRKRREGGKN